VPALLRMKACSIGKMGRHGGSERRLLTHLAGHTIGCKDKTRRRIGQRHIGPATFPQDMGIIRQHRQGDPRGRMRRNPQQVQFRNEHERQPRFPTSPFPAASQ
jgi:hypothetical protein